MTRVLVDSFPLNQVQGSLRWFKRFVARGVVVRA